MISAEGKAVLSSVCEGLGAAVPNCSAEAEGGAVVGSAAAVALWDVFSEGTVVAVIAGLLQPTAKQSAVRIRAAINLFMAMSFLWIEHSDISCNQYAIFHSKSQDAKVKIRHDKVIIVSFLL